MYARGAEYVALNPLDERTANCVFVVEKQRLQRSRGRLSEEFEPLSAALSNSRRIVTGGFTANAAALGPLAHRAKRAALPRILLAGDAAAFVDPFTGQGVYLALAAARMAAEAIERALWQPAAEREAWIAYEGGIWALVAERDRIAAMMKMMLGLRAASQRAARALRRRPSDFAFLIDAVCGNVRTHNAAQLAVAVGKALL
jgi:flavin-dependent dehydrogenase